MKQTLHFKTNINCSNCVANVQPFLDAESRILSWNVETDNKDKILHVETEQLRADDIVQLVKKAGYIAVPLTE
jgi:copper chaperone